MFKLALRNVFRNRRRTILTGVSIGLAVMVVIYLWSFIMGIMEGSFDLTIRSQSGHIRILNSDYLRREKMLPLETNIDDYASIKKIAASDPEVMIATGRIKFGVLLEHKGKNKPVLGTGIDPGKEEGIIALSQKMVEGRPIVLGMEEVNIGFRMSKELDLKLGDTLTVITQTAYGSISAMNLKVVGIFSFGTPTIDTKVFYMPLDKAQQLLDLSGKVTEILLITKDSDKARLVARRIANRFSDKYSVKAWQDHGILFSGSPMPVISTDLSMCLSLPWQVLQF